MITKIVHTADIHIRKTPTRNDEYENVFKTLIKSLKKQKPDRIVIVGDLVHDYLDLQGEQLILAHNWLNTLAKIAPVRITRGNHDFRRKNIKRIDSIKAIVETLHNPDVLYYNKTGFYVDENVTWAVWHHGEKNNNPWRTKDGKKSLINKENDSQIYIDLFHDPISGCRSTTDFEMKSNSYYKIGDFKGDFLFAGDIHLKQYLNKEKTKAYVGSLIAQNVSEGDDAFHGYLLWDVEQSIATPISIKNEHSFKNIKITPYIDFDELDFEIDNSTKFMKIRFIWTTLPQTRNKENERSLVKYVKDLYGDKIISISHKNEFIETEKVDVNENVTLENITDEAVQQEIFKEFLIKIGANENVIADVLALDEEMFKGIDVDNSESVEWGIVKFGGKNFMSYNELDIDWRDNDGLFQITGINTAGKTTIMKIITYILFGKTLETETRKKFGDSRFVNNRNDAKFCEGYLILEANGEYYGIKKKTVIERKRDNTINGAPTTLSYFLLSDPDDEMNDDNNVEKLDEDRRIKTQNLINGIIGDYDNFMRIVMTTSDTLNRILSNDMAVFVDSILFDSGLDIFDKKLVKFKAYKKSVNEKSRISCNVEGTTTENTKLTQEIDELNIQITKIETVNLVDVTQRIDVGKEYVETLTKKLYNIDPEIYNLNVNNVKDDVDVHNNNIKEHMARKGVIEESIIPLKKSYDEENLNNLINKRDGHKQMIYDKKLEIKAEERKVSDWEHEIEIINGKVFNLKKDGKEKRDEITELRESKTCPTCGQPLTAEHQSHIDEKIKNIEVKMFSIANDIKQQNNLIITEQNIAIKGSGLVINEINKKITKLDLEMEDVLSEIGSLTNEKNDVEKRNELQNELNQIPTLIQNNELNIEILQQKINNYDNSQKQIIENQKIEKGIVAAKEKVRLLELEENDFKEDVYIRKTNIGEKQIKIKNSELLIAEFKVQEYRDMIMGLYMKCVHRDGIPREMLSNYIIPKINITLEEILSVANFKVWLDPDDLRPKLLYNDRPDAIIDCIGGSGKERTFASVVLKFALNQINVKAKPTIFLLDEVMGKLDSEGSVEEFMEILQLIKQKMKKVLVIEQNANINPDYLIECELDENGISSQKLI